MLVSYHGIIKEGRIQLQGPVTLPEGAQVLIVVGPSESAETQERRLNGLSSAEWQTPFDAFIEFTATDEPAEIEIDSVGDEELVELVHQVRKE